jgi:di/tricarboxylate transporter
MEFLPESKWREADLEERGVEVVEAMLSPRSRLIGKTLRESHFREKYGLSVLAIWQGDREIATDLADVTLGFGNALLLQGSRNRLAVVKDDPDILLLASDEETEITVQNRGLAAIMIFVTTLVLAVIYPDLTGPIMLGGGLAMMLTRIITTEQAYSAIGWKSVFLVAGMLPMGIALTKTNAAGYAAEWLLGTFGGHGSLLLFAGLYVVTVILAQTVNASVAAAIIGPVAIQLAQQSGVDPRAMVMGIAIATSMTFITPLGHPVNILVMSPGGYGFRDYLKVGLPLTALLFIVVMIFLPVFWSL